MSLICLASAKGSPGVTTTSAGTRRRHPRLRIGGTSCSSNATRPAVRSPSATSSADNPA